LLFLPRSLSFPRHSRTIELMLDELNALMGAWLSERINFLVPVFPVEVELNTPFYGVNFRLKHARELAHGLGVFGARPVDSCSSPLGSFRSVSIPYYDIFSQCLNGFSAPISLGAQFRSKLFFETKLPDHFVGWEIGEVCTASG